MAAAKSTRTQRAASISRHKPRRRHASGTLPDLAPILLALEGARALITVAHIAVRAHSAYGPEEYVLGEGVARLDRVYNALDLATGRLRRLRSEQSPSR